VCILCVCVCVCCVSVCFVLRVFALCVCVCVCVCGIFLRRSTELQAPILLEVLVGEMDSTEWPGFKLPQNVTQWWSFVREIPQRLVLTPNNAIFFFQTLIKCHMQMKALRDGRLRH
jgi:hypothetical protein